RCVKAWRTIHRKDRNQLGKRLGIVSELYTKWVIDRATTLGIHYPLKRPLSSVVPTPSSQPLHFDTKEEFQEQLAELIREKDAWKKRCQIAELENETLKGESFTEMVEMGMCLEEGIRQGRLIKENAPTSTNKKYGNSFSKKKESEVGMVAQGRPQPRYPAYQHVSAITPTSQPQMTQAPLPQYPYPYQQPYPQQPQIRPQTPQQPYNYPNRTQRNPPFDPIPMKYADLLPALLAKNFVQTRPPPPVPAVLPTWYRSDLTCAFHQGAPGHDVERCYALKKAVQELIRNKVLSFKDENPNVRNNPLPNHGSSVHFIQDCQETSTILSVKDVKTPLVPIHSKMCEAKLFSHDHETCEKCLRNPQGCSRVQEDIQRLMDKGELVVTKKSEDVCVIVPEFNTSDRLEMIYNSGEPTVTPLVICLPGPMPYTSLRAVPYRYDATMLQDGVEVPIPPLISVDNIADTSKILRSGRILPRVVQEKTV
ncbi:hypothetical protein TSUD_418400, partial [Trifolium subterraneum]